MGKAGAYTACAVLARYGYGAGLEAAVMALCALINEKPPLGGLTLPGEWHYAEVADRRTGSVARLTSLSTYLYASAHLVGETTRRQGLNLYRGGQPLDTRREAGKREWHRETGKSSPQRMAPSVIISARSELGAIRLQLRAESPSVIRVYR